MSDFIDYLNWFLFHWECRAGFCMPEMGYRLHFLVLIPLLLAIIGAISLILLILGKRKRLAMIGLAPWMVGAIALLYGYYLEPLFLTVTHSEVKTSWLPAGKHVRIALLSDVHSNGESRVMSRLPGVVKAEHPDLLIFAGDAINTDKGIPPFEDLFSRMDVPDGRFAVYGNHDLDETIPSDLYRKSGLTELIRSPVRIEDGAITLCGAPYDRPGDALACLDEAGPGFRIVVYHSPDIVEDAATRGADLVLAGHTHGGQIRLPGYGALITMSAFDKKYESGLYQVGDTALYVTRGIGQAQQFPAVRLFCPPELTIIDVVGTETESDLKLRASRSLGRNPETNLPYGLE